MQDRERYSTADSDTSGWASRTREETTRPHTA
jgi:hypothetical protein